MKAATKKVKLIPPDLKQCQAMVPNGHTFLTLGGVPGLFRCAAKPALVVTESEAGPDGQCGSMSLCAKCYAVFTKQCNIKHSVEAV